MITGQALDDFFGGVSVVLRGVADLATHPPPTGSFPETAGFSRALVFGFPLCRGVLDTLADGPDLVYLHHYRQVNYHLDRVGLLLAALLERGGFRALPVPASQTPGRREARVPLSHRHLAVAAGLGWRGRNNLVVTPLYGSRVRLASVLTDCPMPAGAPLVEGCADCVACRARCPAGAIGDSAADFDRPACFEHVRATCRSRAIGHDICGLCLCGPPGARFTGRRGSPDGPAA